MFELFANTEAAPKEKADLLGALGIDWKLFIIQLASFLILVLMLKKFVFPALFAALEKREKLLEESVRAAHDAEKNAAEAEAKTAKLMKEARKQADELVASAKTEAAQMVDLAEKKSRERADKIVANAEEEIAKSVAAARRTLRNETLTLVAEATEKVVGRTVNAAADTAIIAAAVKEAER